VTRKGRSFVIEAIAIIGAGILAVPVIPTLVSAHDTVALFAALGLITAWVGWCAYFIYRTHSEIKS
jgi:hypothetical protein